MENDELIPRGVGMVMTVVVIMVLAFAIGITFKRESDTLAREKQASMERMYLACINNLTNPDSPQYTNQLKACRDGN